MNPGLLGLALLMGAVTYPWRALPLLTPGLERLPARVHEYLRLVGPSILATLAAVNVMVVSGAGGARLHVGPEWVAVAVSATVMAWRRNLLLGLVAGVAIAVAIRHLS